MGVLLALITAAGPILSALETLLVGAMKLWNDEHAAAGTDPQQLANDATGAAQAAVTLETDVEKQIAMVKTEIQARQPAVSTEHATAVAAAAVATEKAKRAAATPAAPPKTS